MNIFPTEILVNKNIRRRHSFHGWRTLGFYASTSSYWCHYDRDVSAAVQHIILRST